MNVVRRVQVYALWNSSLEWLPTVRATLDTANVNPVGFVSGRRVPCGRCRATGRVRGRGGDAFACQTCASSLLNHLKLEAVGAKHGRWQHEPGHGCRPCLLCDGTGWRLARRGEVGEDEYRKRGANDRDDQFAVRVDRKRQRDNEIAHLERAVAVAEGREAPHWWLSYACKLKDDLYARGSYRELDRAMGKLRDRTPLRHELVTRVEVYHEPMYVSPRTRALIDATADWVAELMPATIRVPAEYLPEQANDAAKASLWHGRTGRHAAARAARRERVLHAHLDWGWTPEQIAVHEALSARRVRQILADHRGHAGVDAAVATGPAA